MKKTLRITYKRQDERGLRRQQCETDEASSEEVARAKDLADATVIKWLRSRGRDEIQKAVLELHKEWIPCWDNPRGMSSELEGKITIEVSRDR